MVTVKHILTLTIHFFKKNIKELISFSIILCISTLLFSSACIIGNTIGKDYDTKHEELHTANAFFTIPMLSYEDALIEDIQAVSGIQEAEERKGIYLSVPIPTSDDTTQDQDQIFYDIADEKSINRYQILEESEEIKEPYIYLSNYTYINSGHQIQDAFTFTLDTTSYSFLIRGVIDEMQYGNYATSMIGQYLSSSAYEELKKEYASHEVMTISVRSKDANQAYNDISKLLNDRDINIVHRAYDEQSKNARLSISNILVLIMSVFSFVMLTVSLLVSKFKIEQSIEQEMTNMGVLKALGYTSKEIILADILPYVITGFLSSILGIALSYGLLPTLAQMIMSQSGFVWQVKVDIISNIIVFFVNMLLISGFTLLAARKIKKLHPIQAIRGFTSNSHGKNHFEMDKTGGTIEVNLALKNFANTKKQNRLLAIVLFFIYFVASFIAILFYNVNMNPLNFVNTLVEEHPDVAIVVKEDIKKDIIDMKGVEHVIYYDEHASLSTYGNIYTTFVAESYAHLENDICYEGENPKSKHEIAVGSKLKKDYNLHLQDVMTLKKNGIEKEYTITGFIQSVNNSGEVIEMTLDGYQQLDTVYEPKVLYVYLDSTTTAKKFIDTVEQKNYPIESIVNYVESMESAMHMYVFIVRVICIAIIVISILLIFLIQYILISSIIIKRKQEFGILKAIGYRNRQLVIQMVGGFVPSTLFAVFIGMLVSTLWMQNAYAFIFEAVGAYKVNFHYPMAVFGLIALLIVVSTLFIGLCLSRKIKKIEVYALIKE